MADLTITLYNNNLLLALRTELLFNIGYKVIRFPIAFRAISFTCSVKISLRVKSRYLTDFAHCMGALLVKTFNDTFGLRLVNKIASVFLPFCFIFHLLKNFYPDQRLFADCL